MCWRYNILVYFARFSLVVVSIAPASSIASDFQVAPSSLNVSVGEQATFYCKHSSAYLVGWLVNDTTLNVLDNNDVTTRSGDTHELNIRALRKYNQTNVRCLGVVDNSIDTSPPATLLIQGTIDAVKNIKRNVSVIAWEPPFSLNLTGIDTDIVYCVEIYNITCGRRDVVTDNCSVFEPYYVESAILLNQEYIYKIAVTPRNNVDGAENGTTFSFGEEFVFFREALLYFRDMESPDSFVNNVIFEIRLITEAPMENMIIPTEYVLSIMPKGSNGSLVLYTTTWIVIDMSLPESTTVFDANVTLTTKQLWDVTVLAYGCKNNPLTDQLELSTHEVQQISVTSSKDKILLSARFTDISTAVGIFVLIYSLELHDDSNVHYLLVPRIAGEINVSDMFGGLSVGPKCISIFTMEDDGLPFSTVATEVKTVLVESMTNDYTFNMLFELQPNPGEDRVCIKCIFLESSTTDCVAVVHQRISQLSSSGLMNIESSHRFNKSISDTAYGCIEGVNLTVFQVGVIGAKLHVILQARDSESSVCTVECIIGSVTGAMLIVMVMVIGALIILMIWIKNRGHCHVENIIDSNCAHKDIKTEVNSAYVMTSLAHSKVLMKPNSAYEDIGRYASALN